MDGPQAGLLEHSRYVWKVIEQSVAVQAQGLCGGRLSALRSFVHATEAASLDCGVIDQSQVVLSPDPAAVHFVDLPSHRDCRALVGLDYKTVRPGLRSADRGRQYWHEIAATPVQAAKAVAFIVASPLSPSSVLLLPLRYLDPQGQKSDVKQPSYNGRQLPLVSKVIEPFPVEWSQFKFPLERLGEGLESLLESAVSGVSRWSNAYTGNDLDDIPCPQLDSLHLLFPSPEDGNKNDFEFLRRLWLAMTSRGSTYAVERLMIQPSVGDFHFLHKPTNQRAAVEIKFASTRVVWNGVLEFKLIRPLDCITAWDFLLCTDQDSGLHAHESRKFRIFARDELPRALFHQSTSENTAFRWKPEHAPKYLDEHLICWSSDEECVAQLESLLESYRVRGHYRAQKVIPFAREFLTRPTQSAEHVAQQSEPLKTPRGRGSNWSGTLWRAERHHSLQHLCTELGRGALFYLPGHLVASFAYSPLCCPDVTFDELSPFAPVVYLNIAGVGVHDEIFATDLRRPLQFQSIVQSSLPSLFLLEPCVDLSNHSPKADHPHKVYLVPSALLDVEEYRNHISSVKDLGKAAIKNHTQVSLRTGQSLEKFRTVRSKVPQILERFAQGEFSTDESRLHNSTMLLRALQPYFNILCTKAEAIRHFTNKERECD